MAIFDPYMVAIFIGCLQQTLCQLDIIGNFMFEANFEVFYSLWVEDILRTLKDYLLFYSFTIGCPSPSLF